MDLDHLLALVLAAVKEAEDTNNTGPAYARLLGYLDESPTGETLAENVAAMTEDLAKYRSLAEQRRLERDNTLTVLGRMEPLRTVLRSWDWSELLKDEHIPDEAVMPVLRAFAVVEKDENEAKQAKEVSRG